MIDIKINDESLDLSKNTVIQWRQRNAFFSEGASFTVDSSLPFNVPLTEKNKRILGQPERTSSLIDVLEYPAVLNLHGTLMNVQLNVVDSEAGYTISVTYDKSAVDMDVNLREMDKGETYSHDKTYWNANISKKYPEVPYNLPMLVSTHENTVDEFEGVKGKVAFNFRNTDTEAFIDKEFIIPMFSCAYILKDFLRANNVFIKGQFINDDVLNDILIYNNTSITTLPPGGLSNYIRISLELGGEPPPGLGTGGLLITLLDVTNYQSAAGTVIKFTIYRHSTASGNAPLSNLSFNHTITAPEASDASVLMTGIKATFNALTGTTFIKEQNGLTNYLYFVPSPGAYWSLTPDLRSSAQGTTAIVDKSAITYTHSDINAKNHLPDITAGELIKAFQDYFNLSVWLDVKDNNIVMNYRNSLVKSDYMDMTEYVVSESKMESNETPNYLLQFKNDANDENAKDRRTHANNYPEHNIKPNVTKSVSAMDLAEESVEYSPFWDYLYDGVYSCPVVKQEVKSLDDGLGNASLRFIKFKGLLTNSKGDDYYTADNDGLTPNEIWSLYYDKWFTKMKADPRNFIQEFSLPPSFVMGFNKEKKWKLSNTGFMWVEMLTTFTMTDVGVTKVTMKKE